MLVRGEGGGASAGGLAWGWASRPRESQRLGEASFLAPLLALFHSGLPAEKEAGVRGGWWGPTANVDAPVPTVQCPPPWTPWLSAE
jgi:hypothetical protein